MKLTPNFSLDEFVHTNHRNINNSLPDELFNEAVKTCQMLERIREYLSTLAGKDIPINISSGYRSPKLNRAVGGSKNSDHTRAQAADWTARKFGTPYQVCKALEPKIDELGIGQIIHEYGRWIHTSAVKPARPVNRIITISSSGTAVGIHYV